VQSASMSQNNTKALISMISGIVGWSLSILIFCFNSTFGLILAVVTWGLGSICLAPLTCIPPFGWLVAVVTGHLALAEIRRAEQGGRGMAIAGLVMGYLGLGLLALLILIVVAALLLGLTIPGVEDLFRELQPTP